MLKKILLGISGLVLLLGLAVLVTLLITSPERPAAASASAQWLEQGEFEVGRAEMVFVDESRPTPANNDFAGSPERTFTTTLWYPENASGALPFVLHSHGLVSTRTDLEYMAQHLASHGYVVASADYPLSNGGAPGGATPADVGNQPADVSFLIDSVLALKGDETPFAGSIDSNRIGLTGYSLGGLTATLATFHPRLRDPRIAATVSIAGPAAFFTERFYRTTDTPFLMIAGTLDALINHRANAAPIPDRVRNSDLLSIVGGTHLGFAAMSEPLLRFLDQPDALGCSAVLSSMGDASSNAVFLELGTEQEGIGGSDDLPEVCEIMPEGDAAHPGRQQMITTLGVLSFFDSVFAEQDADRQQARIQLAENIQQDFVEARFVD